MMRKETLPQNIERGIYMVRILICDDDLFFRTKMQRVLEEYLAKTNRKGKIHCFDGMERISDQILSSCDIAFLDIDFQQEAYTGMNIARKLRKARPDAVIIFVTNYIEYAPEGYEVQAFRYALKNEISEDLNEYLDLAFSHVKATREKIKLQVDGEMVDLPIVDIVFIESRLHTMVAHVKEAGKEDKLYSFYESMAKMEDQLASQDFLRIHKSYLVNMRHIVKYQCKQAVLDDGTELPVSVHTYREQKQKYLLWKGKQS